jgi:multidrug resistance efflux pump
MKWKWYLEQAEMAYYHMLRAKAELEQAECEHALVEAPPRPDEVAAAEGRVRAAEARLRLARAELAKARLRAPTAGRVLRVYAEPGELAGPRSARPVLLFADLSRRHVRAFVEELDAPGPGGPGGGGDLRRPARPGIPRRRPRGAAAHGQARPPHGRPGRV